MPRPPSQPPKPAAPVNAGKPRVWVLRDGQAAPVEIRTGSTNGQMTEVLGGELTVGTQVITEAGDGQS